jgi:hypothetical protein
MAAQHCVWEQLPNGNLHCTNPGCDFIYPLGAVNTFLSSLGGVDDIQRWTIVNGFTGTAQISYKTATTASVCYDIAAEDLEDVLQGLHADLATCDVTLSIDGSGNRLYTITIAEAFAEDLRSSDQSNAGFRHIQIGRPVGVATFNPNYPIRNCQRVNP